MPAFSNVRTFVGALQTGKTNITEALDRLFTDAARHQAHPHFNQLNSYGALNSPLPAWARQALRAEGVTDAELDHIDNKWPDDQKELVRQKLVAGIQGTRRIQFFWELYDGARPINHIQDPDATGDIAITFRSPRAGVKVSNLTYGDISVEA